MAKKEITNEVLYDLILGFKNDVERRFTEQNSKIDKLDVKIDSVEKTLNDKVDKVEKNLSDKIDRVEESLNKKIDKVDSKIDKVEDALGDKIDDLKYNEREDRKILMELYKSRDKVQAQVTWDFIWRAGLLNTAILFIMFVSAKQFI